MIVLYSSKNCVSGNVLVHEFTASHVIAFLHNDVNSLAIDNMNCEKQQIQIKSCRENRVVSDSAMQCTHLAVGAQSQSYRCLEIMHCIEADEPIHPLFLCCGDNGQLPCCCSHPDDNEFQVTVNIPIISLAAHTHL